ncbi:MAG TPA: hypothetical protein VFE72_02850 [Lysobacter sp.]|nr:hypothetical protein [Lysobacter sp.]
MDLFKTALKAFGEGQIGLGAFLALVGLFLLAKLAGAAGQKAVDSVKGLLTEGEKLRQTLNGQLDAAHARSAVLQQARDEALDELARTREELATYRARYASMQDRVTALETELQRATDAMTALRRQLAPQP